MECFPESTNSCSMTGSFCDLSRVGKEGGQQVNSVFSQVYELP